MSRPILEVIALTADDARAARTGGADRLELVADMAADGLTPARETVARVRDAVDIPVRVMLRSANAFTSGGRAALDALCGQAEALRSVGADQFVLGFLDESGRVDKAAVDALVEAIGGCAWTFHRALDRAADRDALRRRLADADGLDTYLTAGSASGVDDGAEVLYAEAARAAGPAPEPAYRPQIMAGGGLRLDHLAGLASAGITAFHIGGAARPGGWATPVSQEAVRVWRTAIDAVAG